VKEDSGSGGALRPGFAIAVAWTTRYGLIGATGYRTGDGLHTNDFAMPCALSRLCPSMTFDPKYPFALRSRNWRAATMKLFVDCRI